MSTADLQAELDKLTRQAEKQRDKLTDLQSRMRRTRKDEAFDLENYQQAKETRAFHEANPRLRDKGEENSQVRRRVLRSARTRVEETSPEAIRAGYAKQIQALEDVASAESSELGRIQRAARGLRKRLWGRRLRSWIPGGRWRTEVDDRLEQVAQGVGANADALAALDGTPSQESLDQSLAGYRRELERVRGELEALRAEVQQRAAAEDGRLAALASRVQSLEGQEESNRARRDESIELERRIARAVQHEEGKRAPLAADGSRLRDALDLVLPDEVLAGCLHAIEIGKPLLLVGPPGVGKTTLAQALPAAVFDDPAGVLTSVEAMSRWESIHVLGDLDLVSGLGVTAALGCFSRAVLESIECELGASEPPGRWLFIDELNRTRPDQAFSGVVDACAKRRLVLPGGVELAIPRSFQLICAMNDADDFGFLPMSGPLRQRFHTVVLDPPAKEQEHRIVAREIERLLATGDPDRVRVELAARAEHLVELMGEVRARTATRFGARAIVDVVRSAFSAHAVGSAQERLDQALASALPAVLAAEDEPELRALCDEALDAERYPTTTARLLGLSRP
ncbi:MAG: AAA family ATPase [Planctomycetota bacterium]